MVHTTDNTHNRLPDFWNTARADEAAEASLNTLPKRTEAEVRIGSVPYGQFYAQQTVELAILVLCVLFCQGS